MVNFRSRQKNLRQRGLTKRPRRGRVLLPTPRAHVSQPRLSRRKNKMSTQSTQQESQDVNSRSTKRYYEEYKSFYLRKSVWEAIKLTRGWHKRGAISRFAECLGITRSMAARIVSGEDGCSAWMMRRIKRFMGINGACWCHLFEEVRCDDLDPNHPAQAPNEAKYRGEAPYNHLSKSAELRSADYRTETL